MYGQAYFWIIGPHAQDNEAAGYSTLPAGLCRHYADKLLHPLALAGRAGYRPGVMVFETQAY
jgi:hypothetical protein